MIFDIFIVSAIGYAFGCLQWSYILIQWLKKEDVRKSGFGNAGASNTFVSYGKKLGISVAVLDALKALISVRLICFLIQIHWLSDHFYLVYLNALFVILGHNFPFFMGFKGGKGTASLVGIFIGLSPLYGFLSVFVILGIAVISNYIAVGTIGLLLYFILFTYLKGYGGVCLTISLLISWMSVYLHLPNFRRIRTGEESKVRTSFSKSKEEK
ncbi:MAG: glycerol-3-phosphate acyltransferase [Peptostreptococcaceae bacterium]|nr:glycerol-3-phosphate acyltransferase [Peptostreptococcaceae bacterium]